MFWGEIAALAGAFCWALASLIFSRFSHHLSALEMTLIKGLVALVLMLLTLLLGQQPLPFSDMHALGWLALSGVIGIAIGDSAYFAALRRIGPNRTLLLESLAPPLAGVLSLWCLHASLGYLSWAGVLLTTLGVTWVVCKPQADAHSSRSGLAFGLLASLCQATGVVISHYALTAAVIPPLWGATLRLAAGTLLIALWLRLGERLTPTALMSRVWRQPKRTTLFFGILTGTYAALWLQQVALKWANPAIAQTLLATSPLFLLPLALVRGEPLGGRLVTGTLLALVGIALFFW